MSTIQIAKLVNQTRLFWHISLQYFGDIFIQFFEKCYDSIIIYILSKMIFKNCTLKKFILLMYEKISETLTNMEKVVHILSTHRGRDKFIRLTSYVGTFLAGQGKTAAGQRLLAVAKEMSGCRVVLRLFDDLPMLAYSLSYGIGAKEKNPTVRIIQILSNIANQLYFPIEHVAWLIDKKVVGFSSASTTWWVVTVAIWAMSLVLEILKSLVLILQKRKESQRLRKESHLNAPDERETTEMGKDIKQQLKTLRTEHNECMLTMFQCLADLMNAINWLPKGFLWGGTFSGRTTGFFGIISTLIMLYKIWPSEMSQKAD